ncbi:MAG: hypothetical protein ACLGHP_04295, partial [Vicinamibacteria bacterium]
MSPAQDATQGFREDDLIPTAPRPVDEMWRELDAIGNPDLLPSAAPQFAEDGSAALLVKPVRSTGEGDRFP